MTRLALEAIAINKWFGGFQALNDVSLRLRAHKIHALLGENGAGKSTLVKCLMGFHRADSGEILLDERERTLGDPREAKAAGMGMVYQHFTLVPAMTVLENLVAARGVGLGRICWKAERRRLTEFLARMPFEVPLDQPVASLAAGQKQKAEILKQLYLGTRLLILDEPTSVLTPQEADEVLGLIRRMTEAGELTVLMITHKFREVLAFADDVTILRRGRRAGGGAVLELGVDTMARLMMGEETLPQSIPHNGAPPGDSVLSLENVDAFDEAGAKSLQALNLSVRKGEVVGIAGVSGNGQAALVEILAGQRGHTGRIAIAGEPYRADRAQMRRHGIALLPEEPLRNACVGKMSVAENIAFRNFDCPPVSRGSWLKYGAIRQQAREVAARYQVSAASLDMPIRALSGGNIQRAVLGRELSGAVELLICANATFGLDFSAAADIHRQIMTARNRGAAVLLVSEDLDELLELSDRILVMQGGRIGYECARQDADRAVIGRHMAGHY